MLVGHTPARAARECRSLGCSERVTGSAQLECANHQAFSHRQGCVRLEAPGVPLAAGLLPELPVGDWWQPWFRAARCQYDDQDQDDCGQGKNELFGFHGIYPFFQIPFFLYILQKFPKPLTFPISNTQENL